MRIFEYRASTREAEGDLPVTLECHYCGSAMVQVQANLPFKLGEDIATFNALPALQCEGCGEYLLEDKVLQRVDAILDCVQGHGRKGH